MLYFLISNMSNTFVAAGTDKAFALRGLFIYPDSRTVPKGELNVSKVQCGICYCKL